MTARIRGDLGVVIVAAGSSTRFGDCDKLFAPLAGKPVLEHSLRVFGTHPAVVSIVLVMGPHNLAQGAAMAVSLQLNDVSICAGGATRSASVRNGLRSLDPAIGLVAIHDAARPLVTAELVSRLTLLAREHGSAIPVIPLSDTVHIVDGAGELESTPDRSRLRAAQTPQIVRRDWITRAYEAVGDATDEATLLHRAGYQVCLTDGDPENVKITRPVDLALAETILAMRGAQS